MKRKKIKFSPKLQSSSLDDIKRFVPKNALDTPVISNYNTLPVSETPYTDQSKFTNTNPSFGVYANGPQQGRNRRPFGPTYRTQNPEYQNGGLPKYQIAGVKKPLAADNVYASEQAVKKETDSKKLKEQLKFLKDLESRESNSNKGVLRGADNKLQEWWGTPQEYEVEGKPYLTSPREEFSRIGFEGTGTFTSAGGPGVGVRSYFPYSDPLGVGIETDIDPTGPGGGVLLSNHKLRQAKNYVLKNLGMEEDTSEVMPGFLYGGVEMAGSLPTPFLGLTTSLHDIDKLEEWTEKPENSAYKSVAEGVEKGMGPFLAAWDSPGRLFKDSYLFPKGVHNPLSGSRIGLGGVEGLKGGNIIPDYKYLSLAGGNASVAEEAAAIAAEKGWVGKEGLARARKEYLGKFDVGKMVDKTGLPKAMDYLGEKLYGTGSKAGYDKFGKTAAEYIRKFKIPYGNVLSHFTKILGPALTMMEGVNILEGALHQKGQPTGGMFSGEDEDQSASQYGAFPWRQKDLADRGAAEWEKKLKSRSTRYNKAYMEKHGVTEDQIFEHEEKNFGGKGEYRALDKELMDSITDPDRNRSMKGYMGYQNGGIHRYQTGGPEKEWQGDREAVNLMHTDGKKYSYNQLRELGYPDSTIVRNWNLDTTPEPKSRTTMAESVMGFEQRPVEKTMTRGEAFRQARAAGEKEFTFEGKRYTTELASDKTPKLSSRMRSLHTYKNGGEVDPTDPNKKEKDSTRSKSNLKELLDASTLRGPGEELNYQMTGDKNLDNYNLRLLNARFKHLNKRRTEAYADSSEFKTMFDKHLGLLDSVENARVDKHDPRASKWTPKFVSDTPTVDNNLLQAILKGENEVSDYDSEWINDAEYYLSSWTNNAKTWIHTDLPFMRSYPRNNNVADTLGYDALKDVISRKKGVDNAVKVKSLNLNDPKAVAPIKPIPWTLKTTAPIKSKDTPTAEPVVEEVVEPIKKTMATSRMEHEERPGYNIKMPDGSIWSKEKYIERYGQAGWDAVEKSRLRAKNKFKYGGPIPKYEDGGETDPLTKRSIRRNTERPETRAESEFYRLYSVGKGKNHTTDPVTRSGWLSTRNKPGVGYQESLNLWSDPDKKPEKKGWETEWVEDYVSKGRQGYNIKAQKGTGRLYPDISADYPEVEYEGDKHWNAKRFGYSPFFGTGMGAQYGYNTGVPNESGSYPDITGQNMLNVGDSDRENRNNLREDIYKYHLADKNLSRKEAWKKTNKFIRQEINPVVNSDFHKLKKKGYDLPPIDAVHDESYKESLMDQGMTSNRADRSVRRFDRQIRNHQTGGPIPKYQMAGVATTPTNPIAPSRNDSILLWDMMNLQKELDIVAAQEEKAIERKEGKEFEVKLQEHLNSLSPEEREKEIKDRAAMEAAFKASPVESKRERLQREMDEGKLGDHFHPEVFKKHHLDTKSPTELDGVMYNAFNDDKSEFFSNPVGGPREAILEAYRKMHDQLDQKGYLDVSESMDYIHPTIKSTGVYLDSTDSINPIYPKPSPVMATSRMEYEKPPEWVEQNRQIRRMQQYAKPSKPSGRLFTAHRNLAKEGKATRTYNPGDNTGERKVVTNYQNGGLPKYQNAGVPTRLDSINLLQNNKILADLIAKGTKDVKFLETSSSSQADDMYNSQLLTREGWSEDSQGLVDALNYEKKNLDPNSSPPTRKGNLVGAKDWWQGGGDDDDFPTTYRHRFIDPQGEAELTALPRDGSHEVNSRKVHIYTYDDLAITPFDMLTPEQKKMRVEKYGSKGVPDSYIKNQTSPTPTTSTRFPPPGNWWNKIDPIKQMPVKHPNLLPTEVGNEDIIEPTVAPTNAITFGTAETYDAKGLPRYNRKTKKWETIPEGYVNYGDNTGRKEFRDGGLHRYQ